VVTCPGEELGIKNRKGNETGEEGREWRMGRKRWEMEAVHPQKFCSKSAPEVYR